MSGAVTLLLLMPEWSPQRGLFKCMGHTYRFVTRLTVVKNIDKDENHAGAVSDGG